MGNFGSLYTGPEIGAFVTSLTAQYFQGSTAAEIEAQLQLALDTIIAGAQRSIFDLNLVGAGDGNVFMAVLETFVANPVEPQAGPLFVRVIEGTSVEELSAKYSAVVAAFVAGAPTAALRRSGVAGSSKGQRFMQALVFILP
jgi:hypothetical protein